MVRELETLEPGLQRGVRSEGRWRSRVGIFNAPLLWGYEGRDGCGEEVRVNEKQDSKQASRTSPRSESGDLAMAGRSRCLMRQHQSQS